MAWPGRQALCDGVRSDVSRPLRWRRWACVLWRDRAQRVTVEWGCQNVMMSLRLIIYEPRVAPSLGPSHGPRRVRARVLRPRAHRTWGGRHEGLEHARERGSTRAELRGVGQELAHVCKHLHVHVLP